MNPLLEVEGLNVTFRTRDGDVRAVRDLTFGLGRGETLGIVGESGSGKSTVALAILGLLPKNASVTGSVRSEGRELLGLREQDLARVRGSVIAYVPQDPLSSLNPAFTVGWQVAETIWTRREMGKEAAYRRAVELLAGGRHPAVPPSRPALPARVLRRHAAAGGDRDRDGQRPGRHHRRRAHHGAGRHDPGAGAGGAAGRAGADRSGDDPDHARPGRCGRAWPTG